MLLGQHESKVDAKARVALPKKFREVLGTSLIITKGYENAVIIVSEKNWKALLEGTEGKPFIQKEARETQRFLLGGATIVSLDSKGRFIIPEYIRRFGKIEGEVVFIGISRYVEMWDKARWEEYSSFLENTITHVSQKLVTGEEKNRHE